MNSPSATPSRTDSVKVRLSSEARQDLIAIGDYTARDNPSRALSFIKERTDRCGTFANLKAELFTCSAL